jgi:hypothetical protein
MDLRNVDIKTCFPKAPSPKIGMNNLFLVRDIAHSLIGLPGIISRKIIFFGCYKGQEISLFQYSVIKTKFRRIIALLCDLWSAGKDS